MLLWLCFYINEAAKKQYSGMLKKNGGNNLIKILKNLTAKEWGLTVISLGLIVFQVWLDLTLPEFIGKITALVQTPGSQMNEILLAGGKMLLLTLGSVAVSVLIAGLAAKIATNLASRLRTTCS